MDSATEFGQLRDMVMNTAAKSSINAIDDKQRQYIMSEKTKIAIDVEKAGGKVDKDTAAKLNDLNNQLKNMEQNAAQGVSSQSQQTAAPN